MKKNTTNILSLFALVLIVGTTLGVFSKLGGISDGVKPAVLGRSYPPPMPDVYAQGGGTIVDSDVSAIISEGTFVSDMYLRVERTARGNPFSASGMWQVSDMWNVRLRNHANNDQISALEKKKGFILAFPYTQEYLVSDQGVRFDENYLKLVRGETSTGPWKVLESSVVDTVNRRISVVTQEGGYYFVGGGVYVPEKSAVVEKSQAVVPAESLQEAEDVAKASDDEVVEVVPTRPVSPVPALGGAEISVGFWESLYERIRALVRW